MVQYITNPESAYVEDAKNDLKNYACTVPFKHIEIHSRGQVSACCHTWLPVWVGNLLTESAEDVLNNLDRKSIQDGMRCGSFAKCNDQCPQLNSFLSGNKDYWDLTPLESLDRRLSRSAMHVGFSYDISCNLQCPSCRNNLIVWRPDDLNDEDGQRIKKIHTNVKALIEILLTEHPIVSLDITGSGDAFASPLYWDYLLELASKPIPNNLRLTLKTNGVMMTEENLLAIKPLWPIITYIEVSVDAATEDVYKIVRKNGNFKKLRKNLEVLDQLVANKNFPAMHNWQTNFIVQKDNFFEIREFVEWQLSFVSKPKIWTNLIAQWYHINTIQFDRMAVWKEGHPDRQRLVDILKDPIFKNPQLKLGNMSSLL